MSRQARLGEARVRIAAIEARAAPAWKVLPFGDPDIDATLPGGGLPLGRWHEAVGEGLEMEMETAAAAGAFVAVLAAPLASRGAVVWVTRRGDLHAPGLAGLGFPAERLIQVRARDEAQTLAALEDALGCPGVAAAIGEAEEIDLVGGRRLQLACERGGATGFVIRRRPFGGAPRRGEGATAAATRWKVAAAPSEPAPGEPGLGAPRWRIVLERCRGGRSGAWILEKRDGAHPLRVVARLGDRQLETPPPLCRAG
ncbi:MAG: ImuA family protein [Caulobacteraceae bacterium]